MRLWRIPTLKERLRQGHREANGRYAIVNACYCCGKSAGEDYWSDRRTDTVDSAGNGWGDLALVMCPPCARLVDVMPDAEAFAFMRAGGLLGKGGK